MSSQCEIVGVWTSGAYSLWLTLTKGFVDFIKGFVLLRHPSGRFPTSLEYSPHHVTLFCLLIRRDRLAAGDLPGQVDDSSG